MRFAVLFFALAAGLLQAGPASPAAAVAMDQADLKSYLKNGAPFDIILIDVRGADEISKAIGTNAAKPYNLAWPEGLKESSAAIPKDRAIVVYCRSGARAAKAADYLVSAGFTRVYNAGGFLTWDGPTVLPAEMKPSSLLPEPSMLAAKK